jgi:metal-dependent amidase/aminoacylase/carboxypeptidase family protein
LQLLPTVEANAADNSVGHACGHNLIAIAGLACAIATKNLLEKNLLQGSVVLFGTPAEEKGSGKIDMLAHGDIQSRVDFCMMLHPSPLEGVYGLMLALDSVTVEYFGMPSHAAGAPFNGRNAVDALMQGKLYKG